MTTTKVESPTVGGQGSSRTGTPVSSSFVSAPGKAEGQADDVAGGVTLRGAHPRPAAARHALQRTTRPAPLWRGDSADLPSLFGARWAGGRDPQVMADATERTSAARVAYVDGAGRRRLRVATEEASVNVADRNRWLRRVGDRLYRDGWGVTVGWDGASWWVQWPDGSSSEGMATLTDARRLVASSREVAA